MKTIIKTNVYIDGFNLYYGATKGTPYKWLDLSQLCRQLLPNDHIQEINIFKKLNILPPLSKVGLMTLTNRFAKLLTSEL